MTKAEFGKGIAILSSCGLQATEGDIKVWERLLMDLDFQDYENAVLGLCREKTEFFPGDNIPALIREGARIARKKRLDGIERLKRDRLTDLRSSPESDYVPAGELKNLIRNLGVALHARK